LFRRVDHDRGNEYEKENCNERVKSPDACLPGPRTKCARVDDAVAQCSNNRWKMFDKRKWAVYETGNK